ncbi:UDP-N-acetylmuramate dehydrogenase [Thiovibrio frasassiensis]|uniref:UDP-N-acetylenolpyruvoylglucosamine reductase n=1 Tax=Thiovibrio frasassiensis TaxID=2984131 RepID=A0A9X4ME75_9BACT|nr:UDP-N-acetylmuramate dehydrogenase [Thiovibrio frasassiensis]MDG4475919.1 UDP-N-acetylmuramate dehydrogenase [Thiovibrio frasassiensis]
MVPARACNLHGRPDGVVLPVTGPRKMQKGMDKGWPEQLRTLWPGEIEWDSPMARWCTLQVGGPAKAIAMPASREELQSLIALLARLGVSWRVIGRGSNLLVSDAGYDGVIVMLGRKFAAISQHPGEKAGERRVRVEAGCSLMKLVNWCARQGLQGLEFAAGIPGSVGGAVVMNAGAWGMEMGETLFSVSFLRESGEIVDREKEALLFSYRHLETEGMIVVAAEFLLQAGDRQLIERKCAQLMRERKEKQPQGLANAGSFFKNPAGLPAAGKLIQDAGLKGVCLGGAQVSEVHANFLVNTGTATPQDFLGLMRLVQEKVAERFGVWLEPEVHIL